MALAERRSGELWVVNHLSDSVSIVDVSHPDRAHVVRTLLVGDEPRDIVFAGADGERAFVTTAHREPQASAISSSTDSSALACSADHSLRALRKIGPLTFTAVPSQSGRRIALDRDLDGVLNGDD